MEQAWAMFSLQETDLLHRQIFPLRSELFSRRDKQNWCFPIWRDCSNGKMLILGSDVAFCVSPGRPSPDTPTKPTTRLH